MSDEYLAYNLDGTFRNLGPVPADLEQMKNFLSEYRLVMRAWDSLIDLMLPGPVNLEVMKELYRSIHNLKGVASFFSDFTDVCMKICHETESFFQRIIDGEIRKLSRNQIDCILRIYNVLKILFNNLDRFIQGREPYYENLDLRKTIESIRLMTISNNVSPEDILPITLNHFGIGENIRISSTELDKLIETAQRIKLNTVELIIKHQENNYLQRDLRFLENTVSRLQDQIRQMRLFPIGLLFESFSGQVYDLQEKLNKSFNLEFRGMETKVDSTVADSVLTPLIHLVRNAIDHGIETRAERKKLGKPIFGKIVISATCRGSEILFGVSDDGRGIDENYIRKIAREKGLDSSLKLKEILCSPGFTSTKSVSAISGRGAGLDAVAAEVERIGGYLELESSINEGCRVLLALPLDFYSNDFLLIQSNYTNYLIPIQNVVKINSIEEESSNNFNTLFFDKKNNKKVPLMCLNEILGYPKQNNEVCLLLESNSNNRLALQVPKLIGQQSVVVRPFRNPFLKKNRIVSSAGTLEGDLLACVIDIDTLFRYANHQ
tara:strand:+ start:1419 stop:3062 length:1644 start_codon:yes stop_codon:yes gene_type:complete